MTTTNNNMASGNDQSGSVISNGLSNPNNLGGGSGRQPSTESQVDYKILYEELERKLGTQGTELGEYRSFFEGVAPLLEKLDKSPELVQAIISGSVNEDLARAAIEGKITVGEAKAISQAHVEVKKELGKAYDKASTEDIARLIEDRVSEAKKEFQSSLKDVEDARAFEQSVNEFINSTPDFADYAKAVEQWLDSHEDVTDIKVAYYAVKGELSEKDAQKRADEEKAEYAKSMAMNAGGGRGSSTYIPEGVDPADALIAGRSNPNIF